ncbi:MAG: tRNA dimethylallyltransferase [Candidatus Krumholzibacteriia bacterium]|jgi:tRNA dimethylallyltransferase
MSNARQSCPAIVGPTAVGKTGLITKLAREFPVEVISLDSRQIYYGLRIGTAQPSAEELAICPHHLIDFISPDEKYDAIKYRKDFERVYLEITQRGGQPLLVGGAGMYLTALREGFMDIPGNTPERLATIRTELTEHSDKEIRDALQQADPASCERIHVNDRYRSQRALEIFRLAGVTMTELAAQQTDDPALGLEFPIFVLERSVTETDERIAARTAVMLETGWIEETQEALAKHDAHCPGLMSIGYREIVQNLEGTLSDDALTAAIILVTRQYAKRQRTMFRHVPEILRGNPDDETLYLAISKLLTE